MLIHVFRLVFVVFPLFLVSNQLYSEVSDFPSTKQNETNFSDLFENKVLPIFQDHCIACHGDTVQMEGLNITTRESLLRGSTNGVVLVPGNADESLFYRSIAHLSEPHMPHQSEKLAEEDIEAIKTWINKGANYQDTIPQKTKNDLWSIQPLQKVTVPETQSNWVRNPIDEFVLSKLQEKNMKPSIEADKRTLIRRLSYDLHGLPPTPEEVNAFLLDNRNNAYELLVDQYLSSPRYGERWARHWLDVVHYADTHGYDKDKRRPHAWRYRDYVIRSINDGKPYGQFIKEQLAGDVINPIDPQGLVSTGFIVAGPWDFVGHVELREGTTDKDITRNLDRDDMLTNTMSTFTSLTVHCARCHDHKFDPISQEEYYQLQSIFAGVERADVLYDDNPQRLQYRKQLNHVLKALQNHQQQSDSKIKNVTSPELHQIDSQINKLHDSLKVSNIDETQKTTLNNKIELLKKERESIVFSKLEPDFTESYHDTQLKIQQIQTKLDQLPTPEWVYTAASQFEPIGSFTPSPKPRPVYLLNRGEVRQPQEEVEPGALSCISPLDAEFVIVNPDDEGERRLALANWIADPQNAIVWRSIVNRIWHYHFGKGIVDTPGDFGFMGSYPSHPELLDWLAVQFLENGQSWKWLHKLIVTSATYRQSSGYNPQYDTLDSGNRYLWRMNRQRLDAESVHDFTLAISGRLDTSMYGPGYDRFEFIDDHSPHYLYENHNLDSPDSNRRSIYRFIVRSVPDPFLQCLDAAEPLQNVHKRNTTITALQALATMNNPFMLRQAQYMAERLEQYSNQTNLQIQRAYGLTLQRKPTQQELELWVDYTNAHGLANTCRLILNLNEFMFID